MKKKQISIKEIAKLSGVSVATVSRVINQNGRFSEETEKRVLDIIDEYQYNTNTVAKTLRMKRSKTIGIVVPDMNNEFFSTLVNQIERHFFEEGYSTFICNTDKDREKEKAYLQTLDAKMVDGLIFISGQEEVEAKLLNRKIPIVCIDRRPKTKNNLTMIESDHLNGGYLATEHLLEKGCRNILFISKKFNLSSVKGRLKGYQKALESFTVPFNQELVLELENNNEHNVDNAKKAVLKEIQKKTKFDGIFATNDWLALGAIRALEEKKINVPSSVKVVGFDDDTIAKYSEIPITTVKQNTRILALESFNILLGLIEQGGSEDQKHIIVPVELIERATT